VRRRAVLVFLLFAGCGKGSGVGEALPHGPPPTRAHVRCTTDTAFPGVWHVSEASAAAEVSLTPGTRELLVLPDSGNHGEAMLWGIPRGPFRPIRLALDATASDDLEGAAWSSGYLYTLTSSGAVRRFSPDGKGGLERDGDAYAIGAPPYVCTHLTDSNCGNNYEGLCLRPDPTSARCAGYAASKTSGKLLCLVYEGDRLRIDPIKPALILDVPRHALSDCAFGPDGPARDILLVTTNVYGGSATYIADETTGALAALDVSGLPNNEAVAIDADGALYQFMDSNTTPSLGYRMTCDGWR